MTIAPCRPTPTIGLALAACLFGCSCTATEPAGAIPGHAEHMHSVERGVVRFRVAPPPLAAPVSVTQMDKVSSSSLVGDQLLPVEAKFLLICATGMESELGAIRSALDYRGIPYDVFVATTEPPLTAARLSAGERGFYQATILTSSGLSVDGASALDQSEWTALADYEAHFHVRRAVLNAWPDPSMGFGPATELNTSTKALPVSCTSAGAGLFRDVNCGTAQEIKGAYTYLAKPLAGAPLTPILTDSAGNAIAVVHQGSDGRESLLLLFANSEFLPHTLLFFHGLIGWVSGGTYLGERRIDLSAQVDDLFLTSKIFTAEGQPDVFYRMDATDLAKVHAWQQAHAAQASTPGFRLSLAFNAFKSADGDPLTEAVETQKDQWHWISHTFDHSLLESVGYDMAFMEFDRNNQAAVTLGLVGYDLRNIVTPNVSGLANPEVMRAAADTGIRFAVTDTSRAGCGNPSPNTAFYNELAPSILMVPRRPTSLFFNVSTPTEWVAEYNALFYADWGRDSNYAQVLDQESDVLLRYLLRGETDPWMFHQANLRAYDGAHSLLSDLLDATLAKFTVRSKVPVRTPPMTATALRFDDRMAYEDAGVRATLFRGRALVIDASRAVNVPITGVRATDGEAYGGDRIDNVAVVPGTSTCVPLDSAGTGCTPAPVRQGGPGAPKDPLMAICNASSAHPPDAGPGDNPDTGSGGCAIARPSASSGCAAAPVLPILFGLYVLGRRRRRRTQG